MRERGAGFTIFRKYPRGGGEQGGGLQVLSTDPLSVRSLTAITGDMGSWVSHQDWEAMHEDTTRTIVSGWSPLPHLQYQGRPGCFKDSTLWRGNKHSLDPTLGVCGEHALESQPRV